MLSPEGLQILKIKASKSEEDARGRGELVWMTGGEIRVEVSCSAQRGAQEDWGEDDQLCLGAQTARVPPTCSSTTIPVFPSACVSSAWRGSFAGCSFPRTNRRNTHVRTRRDVLGYLSAPNHTGEPECREKQGLILEVVAVWTKAHSSNLVVFPILQEASNFYKSHGLILGLSF